MDSCKAHVLDGGVVVFENLIDGCLHTLAVAAEHLFVERIITMYQIIIEGRENLSLVGDLGCNGYNRVNRVAISYMVLLHVRLNSHLVKGASSF